MVWKECSSDYPTSLAAGINLFMGSCGSGQAQLEALAGKAYSVLDAHASTGVDGRGLIGWYQPDEADDSGAALAALTPSKQSRRVSFITLSNHFFSAASPLPQGNPSYPKLIAPVDAVGFDLYPLQIWCRTDAYQAVYQAQRELVALAAGKPTFQWIEAATWNGCAGKPRSPTARTVRAETWLAIAGGARGIGYFPYYWPAPIAKEIASINRDIAALAPALLGPEAPLTTTAGGVYAGARSFDGARYVIAVNATTKDHEATFTLPGLGTTVGWVYGEGRTVPVRQGDLHGLLRAARGAHLRRRPARLVSRVTRSQRLTLGAAILGSAVAMLDGTIVNVALPAIERDLGGGLPAQQWVSNSYLLALGSLILIGGSLGDIYGQRRVFAIGVTAFGVLSLACAVAPNDPDADRGPRAAGGGGSAA